MAEPMSIVKVMSQLALPKARRATVHPSNSTAARFISSDATR